MKLPPALFKILALIAVFFIHLAVSAQVPQLINYQARLTDVATGLPVDDGEYAITFSFYETSTGGSALWTESQSVQSTNGIYSVLLGSINPLDVSLFSGATRYLGITVGSDPEMMPRKQMVSVPYAFSAEAVANEADPVYSASQAANITENDIVHLGNLSGINTGDQMLVLEDHMLSITNGNTVALPEGASGCNIPIYTTAQIAELTPEAGNAVFNSTESLFQIFNGIYWVSWPVETNCWPEPTPASAGADQYVFNTSTTSLAANEPLTGHGTGTWSIISGSGGSFADVHEPNTNFTGEFHTLYKLQWTISTTCNNVTDSVFVKFVTSGPGEPITDADGNNYNTVWIGTQRWMTENLKTTRYNDNASIPLVTNNDDWNLLTTPAYCWYNNDQATYGDTYGALYNWYAVETGKLCPVGWHAPTDAEWSALTEYLGGESSAGNRLKETGTLHWNSPNTGTNESGFTALPGGTRQSSGVFDYLGTYGIFWTSTVNPGTYSSWIRVLHYWDGRVDKSFNSRQNANAVRCVKD